MYTLSLDGADSGHGRETRRPSTANLSMDLTAEEIFDNVLVRCAFPETVEVECLCNNF